MTETTKKTRTTTARMTRTAPKNTIMKDNEWDNDDTDNDDRGGGGGDDGGGSFVFREHPLPGESKVHASRIQCR